MRSLALIFWLQIPVPPGGAVGLGGQLKPAVAHPGNPSGLIKEFLVLCCKILF
jgi:hypothetical protein